MATAMVLCAGYGTRLRPLTDELPKPLLPVGDRPQLAHIHERLRAFGASPVVANLHHLAGDFQRKLGSTQLGIHCVVEPELRGTAGGVAGARDRLQPGPVLVWNGDILADAPLERLIDALGGAGLALAVAPRRTGEGSVGVGNLGEVVRLRGMHFGHECQGGDFIGVSAVRADNLQLIPAAGCLIGDHVIPMLERGELVRVVWHVGEWADTGTGEDYLQANIDWLGAERAWIGPRATVSRSVELDQTIVGAGSSVTGTGGLTRVVVWPGATARAPLTDAVVTPRSVVPISRRT